MANYHACYVLKALHALSKFSFHGASCFKRVGAWLRSHPSRLVWLLGWWKRPPSRFLLPVPYIINNMGGARSDGIKLKRAAQTCYASLDHRKILQVDFALIQGLQIINTRECMRQQERWPLLQSEVYYFQTLNGKKRSILACWRPDEQYQQQSPC